MTATLTDPLASSPTPADVTRLQAVPVLQAEPRPQRFYHPELDAIRIFLFFGVWAYHVVPRQEAFYTAHHLPASLASAVASVVTAGMCSLDVFFILSAFLITELLLRERELRGRVDLKAFYVRRLLRIWPLYFFVIALTGLLSLFDRTQAVSWAYIASFLLFAGNWMMAVRGAPAAVAIIPLWSVSFEEQFYLLWPLVLRRASRRTVAGIAIAMLAVASVTRLILLLRHTAGDPIWYNTFARLDSIACGILLALAFHGRALFRPGLRTRLGLVLVGAGAWLAVGRWCGLLDGVPTLTGGLIGYPLMSLGGVAIFLAILGAAQDGMAFMKHPALVYFGKLSYGLYLYHMLSLHLAGYVIDRHMPMGQTLVSVIGLLLTLLLAAISFKWLETPFLRLKQRRFTYVASGAPSS
ncbi:MAG TPA: acyltransferase [Terriglobales bacterium]|jgi:peptidoglycan/LPS O-acetylase OafA/YrhL|nr:acyltransferase [Terriglobales bacterium]